MTKTKKVLLLVGSPKPNKSSSEALGNYLLEQLALKGMQTEKILVNKALKSEADIGQLLSAAADSDIIIISSPLYVDGAPAGLTHALEIIAEKGGNQDGKKTVLLAISNSGFPEAMHNQTALDIYRSFAEEAGFIWAGGLALGAGGAIDGRTLEKLGGMVKNIRRSLDLAAQALSEEQPIPNEAVQLMAKPFMPNWLYLLGGNFLWKSQAKKNGVKHKINDKPYAN